MSCYGPRIDMTHQIETLGIAYPSTFSERPTYHRRKQRETSLLETRGRVMSWNHILRSGKKVYRFYILLKSKGNRQKMIIRRL